MHEVFHSLARLAREQPGRTAIVDDHGILGYRELASRVASLAIRLSNTLAPGARTVAIMGQAGASWIVADLAATHAGLRVVPVPGFFSAEQVHHVLADAQATALLCCDLPGATAAAGPGFAGSTLRVNAHADRHEEVSLSLYRGGAERVIYTSGTTGVPKGVVHGDRQIGHAIGTIAAAVSADSGERHLSALPPSLLLEQIAGVFIPLAVGAQTHVSARAIGAALGGDTDPLRQAFTRTQPTTTVLVPQLLAALTASARAGAWTPPGSLRFAAAGGAPMSLSLVRAARAAGIPVIRGYGLSECASVVAVERPRGPWLDVEGACGPALPGLHVHVDDGELVVRGPTVMDGYLHREPVTGSTWRTGDAGALGPRGEVVVYGRRDRVLVLPSGRNVQADWVEGALMADPRVRAARLTLGTDGVLDMDCYLHSELAARLHDDPRAARLHRELEVLLAALPAYAKPGRMHIRADSMPARGSTDAQIERAHV